MSSIQLQLDGDALREATVQAMLGVLTPEAKAKLMENAIMALLTPSTNSWDKKKSPIELAFDQAIVDIARKEAKQLVENDAEIRTKINSLMRSTADKILNTDQEKLAIRMADAFVDSIKQD